MFIVSPSSIASTLPLYSDYSRPADLVTLHAVSDALIAISYYAIQVALAILVLKRDELPRRWVVRLFVIFAACGTCHALSVWALWYPEYYWASGMVKAGRALLSVAAAAALVPTVQQFLKLPRLMDIEAANQQLRKEIAQRQRVEIALKRSEAHKEAIMSHIERRMTSRSIKILVVDDFESDRFCYRRHLREDSTYRYEFIEAEDSAEAFELTKQHQPDVILLDYGLPDSEGLDTLAQLRQQHPGVFPAIIMLTGQGNEEIAVGAIKAGAAEYLVKGRLTSTKLTTVIHRVLQQQQLQLELDRSQRRRQLIADSALRIHRSIDLQETLTTAAQDIQRLIGCDSVNIYKLGGDRCESMVLVAGGQSHARAINIQPAESLKEALKEAGEPIILPGAQNSGAQLVVPIYLSPDADVDWQRGPSWGLLLANYAINKDPAAEDPDILAEIAVQLGISIQQTSLLEKVQGELIERRKAEQSLARAQKSLEQINQSLEVRIQERTARLMETNQQLEREVEQRCQIEAALREQEHQLRLFVKYAPAAVAMFDSHLRYMVHSQRWLEDYSLGNQNILGRSHYEVFPEIPDRWKQDHQRCLAGEILTCDEDCFVRESGETEWIRWELHPWYTDLGTVGGLIMLTEVTTERKRLQRAVLTQQEMLKSFFEAASSANIGTAILDREFRYLQTNQALADIDGLSPEEHIGKHVQDIVPDIAATILPLFEQVVQNHTVVQQEVSGLSPLEPDNLRHWLASFFPIYSDDQLKQLGVVTLEITQQKQNEQQLEKLNDELQRSNKELEHFAYVASHDLREPLRKVRSYCDLLSKRYQGQLDDRADKYIGYITDGSMRMMHLINDLLDYSRVGRGVLKPEPLQLEHLLNQVLGDLQHKVQENQAEIRVCTFLPPVQGNAVQIRQLLQNIIGNSLKYRSQAPPVVTIDAVQDGEFCRVSVADNGIGIPPEFFERIFVVFQRLHVREAYEGTGIGLAVCKRIVEHHGGKIWVESQVGQGTTFYFTLPTFEEAIDSAPTSASESAPGATSESVTPAAAQPAP